MRVEALSGSARCIASATPPISTSSREEGHALPRAREYEIEHRFGEKLRKREPVVIWEEESEGVFGKLIKTAMKGRCLLEEGTRPAEVTPTIPRHLGLIGYSSRVGSRRSRRNVEIWLPTEPSSVRESQPYIVLK